DKHQTRELDSGSRRRLEGGRGRDRINHVVEIVVIPVPPDPGRVGGIRERRRREPDEQGNDDQYEDATGNEHRCLNARPPTASSRSAVEGSVHEAGRSTVVQRAFGGAADGRSASLERPRPAARLTTRTQ